MSSISTVVGHTEISMEIASTTSSCLDQSELDVVDGSNTIVKDGETAELEGKVDDVIRMTDAIDLQPKPLITDIDLDFEGLSLEAEPVSSSSSSSSSSRKAAPKAKKSARRKNVTADWWRAVGHQVNQGLNQNLVMREKILQLTDNVVAVKHHETGRCFVFLFNVLYARVWQTNSLLKQGLMIFSSFMTPDEMFRMARPEQERICDRALCVLSSRSPLLSHTEQMTKLHVPDNQLICDKLTYRLLTMNRENSQNLLLFHSHMIDQNKHPHLPQSILYCAVIEAFEKDAAPLMMELLSTTSRSNIHDFRKLMNKSKYLASTTKPAGTAKMIKAK